jgi:hypothetical protein
MCLDRNFRFLPSGCETIYPICPNIRLHKSPRTLSSGIAGRDYPRGVRGQSGSRARNHVKPFSGAITMSREGRIALGTPKALKEESIPTVETRAEPIAVTFLADSQKIVGEAFSQVLV